MYYTCCYLPISRPFSAAAAACHPAWAATLAAAGRHSPLAAAGPAAAAARGGCHRGSHSSSDNRLVLPRILRDFAHHHTRFCHISHRPTFSFHRRRKKIARCM